MRTYAPARQLGFAGFSPFALPNVIEVAEGIPFIELTDWDHDRLYALKGEIVRRGVQAVTGTRRCRSSRNAASSAGQPPSETFAALFPADEVDLPPVVSPSCMPDFGPAY